VTKPDKVPAAGYLLTARTLPNGLPREIGTTDRDGRIVIPAGFADGLIIVRLLAGNIEPMVEFPVMPGASTVERVIPFNPKPLTVTLETELDSIRDDVIDLVAIRARLEARLKARYDGEDWAGVEAAMNEFYQLPPRATFAEKLAKLKQQAVETQAKSKTVILTATAQAQLADVQALVDRYLDDELFNGYAEGIKQYKAQAAAQAKTNARKKAARARAAEATAPRAAPKAAGDGAVQPSPAPLPAPTPGPAAPGLMTPPNNGFPRPPGSTPKSSTSKPASKASARSVPF
jgi:hypothetical protein